MGSMDFVALDGSRTNIDLPDLELTGDFSTSATVNIGGKNQKFCSGPLFHGRDIASSPELGVVNFEEEYFFQGGNLRLGRGEVPAGPDGAQYFERDADGNVHPVSVRFALWEGASFCLHTQVYAKSYSLLLALLNECQITESRRGAVLSSSALRAHSSFEDQR